jgi:hypothetical protein
MIGRKSRGWVLGVTVPWGVLVGVQVPPAQGVAVAGPRNVKLPVPWLKRKLTPVSTYDAEIR